jgi:putative DNA primase/helicase
VSRVAPNGHKAAVDPTQFAALIQAAMPAEERLALLSDDEDGPDRRAAACSEQPPLEQELRDWAATVAPLSDLERELARNQKREALAARGVPSPSRLVDAALKEALELQGPISEGLARLLRDPEPWPQPVEGGALLDELRGTLARYMVLPRGAATAITLWIVMSHCFEIFPVLPMLNVCSPTMRCGKSRLLELLAALVRRPLVASNLTHAVIFRTIDKFHPTLLLDEVETYLHGNEDMRGVLNGSHARASAVVVRLVGDAHEPRLFATFCPKVVAGIGRRAPTIEDRAIAIELRRRAPRETVEPLRLDRIDRLGPLCRRAARWAADHQDDVARVDPEMPALSSDRALDNWRPLLAIATVIGGQWPARARQAALLLSGKAEVEETAITLLGDLRDLFARAAVDRLASEDVVRGLTALEERPWSEWRQGRPLSPAQLATLLRPFAIRPQTLKLGAKHTLKGYHLHQFDDAFARYLPAAPVTTVTFLQNAASGGVTARPPVADQKAAVCSQVTAVTARDAQAVDAATLARALAYLADNCDAAGASFGTWAGMRNALGIRSDGVFESLVEALVARGVTPPRTDKPKCHPLLKEAELRRAATQLRHEVTRTPVTPRSENG